MSRTWVFAISISTMLLVVAGIHYYLWVRLVRDLFPAGAGRNLATVALVILGVSGPVALVGRRLSEGGLGAALTWTGYIWMGTMFLMLVVLVGADLIKFLLRTVGPVASSELAMPERREALTRALGMGAAISAGGLSAVALRQGLKAPDLKRVQVKLARLPESLSGLRIVQLSDVHVGPTIGIEVIRNLVARVNALKPDLVAITGDLVDGSVEALGNAVRPLGELQSTHGTFFVTGNHEYYSGVTPWIEFLEALNIRVLRNERVLIGDGDDAFYLAGVDDSRAKGMVPGHGADVDAALRGRDAAREIVLLAHQPVEIDAAARNDVGLQLSGHTHGGQIWPFNFLVRLVQPYVAGLALHGERTQIYVSRGTAYWGPPMRLGAPSELTEIELIRQA